MPHDVFRLRLTFLKKMAHIPDMNLFLTGTPKVLVLFFTYIVSVFGQR